MHALLANLRPLRRPARILYCTAAAWVVVGVLHIIPLALDGWDLSGAVSFRKPLVFAISVALLLATSGWILDRMPDRPRLAGRLAWTLAVSSTVEVALIAVQTWRGEPSHFNMLGPENALIFGVMGVMVAVMSGCLIVLFVWTIIRKPADPLVRVAVLAGMALVMTGLGLGQWIVDLGVRYFVAHGAAPDTVLAGERGVAKFPHAVAFHGVQVFIAAALALRHGAVPALEQRRWLHAVVAGYTGILLAACAQTVTGHAPTELSIWTAGAGAATAVGVVALARITAGLLPNTSRTAEPDPVELQLQ